MLKDLNFFIWIVLLTVFQFFLVFGEIAALIFYPSSYYSLIELGLGIVSTYFILSIGNNGVDAIASYKIKQEYTSLLKYHKVRIVSSAKTNELRDKINASIYNYQKKFSGNTSRTGSKNVGLWIRESQRVLVFLVSSESEINFPMNFYSINGQGVGAIFVTEDSLEDLTPFQTYMLYHEFGHCDYKTSNYVILKYNLAMVVTLLTLVGILTQVELNITVAIVTFIFLTYLFLFVFVHKKRLLKYYYLQDENIADRIAIISSGKDEILKIDFDYFFNIISNDANYENSDLLNMKQRFLNSDIKKLKNDEEIVLTDYKIDEFTNTHGPGNRWYYSTVAGLLAVFYLFYVKENNYDSSLNLLYLTVFYIAVNSLLAGLIYYNLNSIRVENENSQNFA